MIKRIQLALSAILLASLALYGWAQNQPNGLPSREEESRIALERHEARVIRKLNLTAKQNAEYDKLRAWTKKESAKLPGMSNRVEYGMEINRKLHEGLKRIFTPEQYKEYMRLWEPTPLKYQDPMAGGKPFSGTDEAIMNALKPTPAQWSQYREFLREQDIRNDQYYALMKTDPNKAAWMGHETNRWTRTSMRRILTEDQYYEWIRLWDEVVSPYLGKGNGDSRRSPARPIAGRAGGG